jgi:sugar lactone lactonase YvrE
MPWNFVPDAESKIRMRAKSIASVFPALLASVCSFAAPVQQATVTTVIDNHHGGVGGVTSDQMGYIYVADFLENVWRLNPTDMSFGRYVSGSYGASGNTFDKNGNLYQANYFGQSIDRISRSGERTTVISEGLAGPVGMTFDANGSLFICDCNDQTIKKATPDGDVTTFATSDHFNCPNGITQNNVGEFFVVSFSGSKIVKVTPEGETSVFADTGGNGLGHITYLRGVFYATSFYDNKVYRITEDGAVTHFAGTGKREVRDGVALESAFSNPNGISADPTGTYLYINDKVSDENETESLAERFSIRRIELPRAGATVQYSLDNENASAATEAYRAHLADAANSGENTEPEMNTLGWSYLLKNDYDNSILVFELNVETYPNSWGAWSSLGAAFYRSDKRELAIKALEKSLELNPENKRAIVRLKALQGD